MRRPDSSRKIDEALSRAALFFLEPALLDRSVDTSAIAPHGTAVGLSGREAETMQQETDVRRVITHVEVPLNQLRRGRTGPQARGQSGRQCAFTDGRRSRVRVARVQAPWPSSAERSANSHPPNARLRLAHNPHAASAAHGGAPAPTVPDFQSVASRISAWI